MPKHSRELSEEDIRQMAHEAEAENLLQSLGVRKPRGHFYRRAAIMLKRMPLSEITVDELAWDFAMAIARGGYGL